MTCSRHGPGSRSSGPLFPNHVTIGVSGDAHAATGLAAGCNAWYSVIGGALPALALNITAIEKPSMLWSPSYPARIRVLSLLTLDRGVCVTLNRKIVITTVGAGTGEQDRSRAQLFAPLPGYLLCARSNTK